MSINPLVNSIIGPIDRDGSSPNISWGGGPGANNSGNPTWVLVGPVP